MSGYNFNPASFFTEIIDYFSENLNDNVKRLDNLTNIFSYKYKPKKGYTPGEVVYENNKLKLIRFKSDIPKKYKTPILFVYSIINKWYVVDLMEERSLIKFLVNQGYDVYVTDWGSPSRSDKSDGLYEYICDYLNSAVDFIRTSTMQDEITLYGYCLGGTFSVIYAALYPDKIRNLIAMTTPIDFQTEGLFEKWTNKEFFDVDRIIETYPVISADFIEGALQLKNITGVLWKGQTFYENLKNDKFLTNYFAMEGWLSDNVPIAGYVYTQIVKEFYQQNALLKENLTISKNKVSLKDIKSSVLNIVATKDNIVPPRASLVLKDMVSSKDTHDLVLNAGHIGIVAGGIAAKMLWPGVDKWLSKRSM
jgi:polyhydroxyalkanoate synthase